MEKLISATDARTRANDRQHQDVAEIIKNLNIRIAKKIECGETSLVVKDEPFDKWHEKYNACLGVFMGLTGVSAKIIDALYSNDYKLRPWSVSIQRGDIHGVEIDWSES